MAAPRRLPARHYRCGRRRLARLIRKAPPAPTGHRREPAQMAPAGCTGLCPGRRGPRGIGALLRLARVHEVHRREDTQATGCHHRRCTQVQESGHAHGSLGHYSERFHELQRAMRRHASRFRTAKAGKGESRTGEGLVPGNAWPRFLSQVSGFQQLEPDLPQRVVDLVGKEMSGNAAPISRSVFIFWCRGLLGSKRLVSQYSYAAKHPPGLSTRNTSP